MDSSSSSETGTGSSGSALPGTSPFAANLPGSGPYSVDPGLQDAIALYFTEASARHNERLVSAGFDQTTTLAQEVERIFKTNALLSNPATFKGFSIYADTGARYGLFDRPTSESPWHIESKRANPSDLKMRDWVALSAYAYDRGFVVTAGYSLTGHNKGSAHGLGTATDQRTWDKTRVEVDKFILNAFSHGVTVRDERVQPPNQKVWKGAHVHIETPKAGQAPRLYLSSEFGSSGVRVKQPKADPPKVPSVHRQSDAPTAPDVPINRP